MARKGGGRGRLLRRGTVLVAVDRLRRLVVGGGDGGGALVDGAQLRRRLRRARGGAGDGGRAEDGGVPSLGTANGGHSIGLLLLWDARAAEASHSREEATRQPSRL